MKYDMRRFARPVAMMMVATVLVGATALLVCDAIVSARTAAALAQRLSQAEEAARLEPSAAAAFNFEVTEQTTSSLARSRRQRTAGIVALVAAAIGIVLIKFRQIGPPPIPREVAAAVKCPTTDDASTRPVDEPRITPATTPPGVDLAAVDAIVQRVGRQPQQLIPLLHAINKQYHYLPPTALGRLAEATDIPFEQIAGVASFYAQFRSQPRGAHLVQVCRGTACHVAGASRIHDELRRELGLPPGQDTDSSGVATLETVGCLGCCTLAPVIRVDDRIEGHTSVPALPHIVDFSHAAEDGATLKLDAAPVPSGTGPAVEIRIGLGSCCVAGGSRDVMERLQREIVTRRLNAVIRPVGCVGICHLTPLVEVVAPGAEPIVATRATAADVRQIVRSLPTRSPWPSRLRNRLADAWRPGTRSTNGSNGSHSTCQICPLGDARIRHFIDPQVRIVTEHSGQLDPTSLREYRQHDGFAAWERCLQSDQPASIIATIEGSGLRGRGGGGYLTSEKWSKVRCAVGTDKYVICNGDEGDPGAFMDRMIMESYPYRVLEGMAIAAYAVGARRAIIYVRHEYPLAVQRLRHAIQQTVTAGLLGDNIGGTDFSLQVDVFEGAGAFVCGEETALLQSMMGRRGIPQLRPPYPAKRGLFDKPTLVNNVETFANVPWIMRHGAEQFAALGTTTCTGTKVFSLAGKIRRAGLIEIPMGMTIRQVVEQIGGGVAPGKRFKAVQIGGPSGGCVPAELADTPIDYENLQRVGAILGSGGLVVLDDDDCMVDVARYFLEFIQRESCGHCSFCRVGTRKLLDILERLCTGKGRPRDLDEIESLSSSISLGSLCGLGKTAPNPVLSTLRHFRHEYEAHLAGRCPAGRCPALIRYEVTRECVGCTLCAQHCPVGAIPLTPYRQHVIDANVCTRCDACRVVCPEEAITVV